MKDFYSMAAFFDDIEEPAVGKQRANFTVPDAGNQKLLEEATHAHQAASSRVLDFSDCFMGDAGILNKLVIRRTPIVPGEVTDTGCVIPGKTVSLLGGKHAGGIELSGAIEWRRKSATSPELSGAALVFRIAGHNTEGEPIGNINFFIDGRPAIESFPVKSAEGQAQSVAVGIPVPEDLSEMRMEFTCDSGAGLILEEHGVLESVADTPLPGFVLDVDAMTALASELGSSEGSVAVPDGVSAESLRGATLTRLDDGSFLSSGANPDRDIYKVEIPLPAGGGKIHGIYLEALRHESMANGSLSRANGNFVLTGFEAWLADDGGGDRQRLELGQPVASFEQNGWPVVNSVDGKKDTGWAIQGWEKFNDRQALYPFSQPLDVPEGKTGLRLEVLLKHESAHARHNIGRFRLGLVSRHAESLDQLRPVPSDVIQLVKAWSDRGDFKSGQLRRVLEYAAAQSDFYAGERAEVKALDEKVKEIRSRFRQMLVVDRLEMPRTTRILARGNWMDESGEIVEPAVPAFLPAGEAGEKVRAGSRLNRMDLAEWITDPSNPLTSRAFVNRLWKIFFGHGLSRNLDDLGGQGQPPTHPELLDYLASEFRDNGWDVKDMVRKLVMSRAYRQSSIPSDWLQKNDPGNTLFARQSRFRLDAEFVRDTALEVSGLLVDTIGGDSARPYQPAGYWQHLNFPRREYQADTGDGLYRRGLYTYWCRTFLHPSLLAFDAPSREECTAERARSNTPQQALVLLNDPTYVEAAHALAAGSMNSSPLDLKEAISLMFRKALSREPDSLELSTLHAYCHEELKRFEADPNAAKSLISVGEFESAAGENGELVRMAALTSVARAILNLYETTARY
jgi:hypothetical protein